MSYRLSSLAIVPEIAETFEYQESQDVGFEDEVHDDGDMLQALSSVDDAAASGIEDPLYRLGISHAAGVGVEQNMIVAHKWFNIAAMRGNAAARAHRAAVAVMLTSEEIAEALRMAREWMRGEAAGVVQIP